MGYNKDLYKAAFQKVKAKRLAAEDLAAKQKSEFMRKYPVFRQIETELQQLGLQAAVISLKSATPSQEIRTLQKKQTVLNEKKQELLSSVGTKNVDFSPAYSCQLCNDTGYHNGKLCDCVRRIARDMVYAEMNKSTPISNCSFENFRLDLYPNQTVDVSKRTIKEKMEDIYCFCKQYANSFSADSGSLIFLGKTGLGKTHLSLAIAKTVIDKGFGVIYGQTGTLLHQIEREHFGTADKALDSLQNILVCDLLILDDLGTEFCSPFVTSTLYTIINSRILSHSPTIISTNLTLPEIEAKYTERILSRFVGNYTFKQFSGVDMRQQQALGKL